MPRPSSTMGWRSIMPISMPDRVDLSLEPVLPVERSRENVHLKAHAGWNGLPKPLVDEALEPAQQLHHLQVVCRQQLHHDDRGNAAGGIDPEMRVEDTGPAQASRAAHASLGWRRLDLKSEAERVLPRPRGKRHRQRRVV